MTTSRGIRPFRVRPHLGNGEETGRYFVDVPASVEGAGERIRKLFDNQRTALAVARELKRRLGADHTSFRDERRIGPLAICARR